ncbi:hypothetical protein HELRODRAFT_82314 [Helobdella robusta]|uniref:EF-hand domain-containing protein n=1 Tax=Helobdella robusta TaxID=6412 RepID=T1G4Q6_HELRO|nr:hypothetical protein HELRODRAFT_82314 [Helobdella robusta]ESO01023.1 hypothetical protein HELRODRAFT_82314 [Helobdella robusta]
MRVAFSMFDKDGDGLISLQEVHDTMASLGIRVSAKDVKQIVKRVDLDGRLVVCELSDWTANKLNESVLQELADAFQVFDKDKDGFLSADDLRCTMQQLGLTLTEEDLKAMMTSAKIGPSGRISFAGKYGSTRVQSII